MAAKQRHIGFLMILMQRLVTSSTAAIRATLEKRQALLDSRRPAIAVRDRRRRRMGGARRPDAGGYRRPGQRLGDGEGGSRHAADLARSTEAQGTDAKAEALLELIYKLQQEENDPELKVLVFTEFVPTQAMLAEFPGKPGLFGRHINGSMDLDARSRRSSSIRARRCAS
jgi:hypothetical protein